METSSVKLSVEESEYISSMSDKEKQAYLIAKEHLETSFDLSKSIGFTKFMKNKK